MAAQEAGRIMEALQKACLDPAAVMRPCGRPVFPSRSWWFDKNFHKKEAVLSIPALQTRADSLPPSTLLYLPRLIHF
ncbi:MAG: hypothetical protein ACLR0U_14795 [Enterocloster clostridioformis]